MSIKVSNLSKTYGAFKAVNSISFAIKKGEIVGFLGPNGAGKSTVMKVLTGYISDFEGEVFINDKSVVANPIEIKKAIGYLPEHNPLYLEMYVKEYLAFQASIYKIDNDRIDTIIDQVGLTSQKTKKIKKLSKGYRQRVGLAAALLHDPDVIILDEPTTGLDPNQLIDTRQLIKKLGKDKTVLFSTHILQEVEAICDRVIIIHKGEIVVDHFLQDLQNQKEQLIEVEFDKKIKKSIIDSLPNIKKSYCKKDTIWELTFYDKKDKRADVFDFAHENELKILSLTQKNNNLENLFGELTKN